MDYDPRFVHYFKGRIRQIYLYVTDVCGLRCEQCLYKTTLANRELKHNHALEFIRQFAVWGAKKVTFIGGEPFLYGRRAGGRPLLDLIGACAAAGYEYIRIDTNGQQRAHLLREPEFALVSNLAVSIDGHSAEISDGVRGKGSFERSVAFVKEALDARQFVSVTTCVHRGNVEALDKMIEFVASLGVRELNFHPLFKMGIARDHFSGDTDITPTQWVEQYEHITERSEAGAYPIPVRLPRRFVDNAEYAATPWQYDYCPTLMGERILIHPDGDMRICALCIGTPLRIATYSDNGVIFCGDQSEISPERRARKPCMSQQRDFGNLIPLCISYKPRQDEYVWRTGRVDERLFGAAPVDTS
jgi:MoaA/NifB/PqqE/SkfB family radical SAM enzyme